MRIFVTMLMLSTLFLPNAGLAGTTEMQQTLHNYFSLAAKIFPPQLELAPTERLKLRKQLDACWQPRKAGAKNFLFIKQNARYPHKLSNIQADGDSGSAIVSFTPDPGSLAAAAPMYFATRARYALKKHQGKWKLTGFEAIKQKQQRAVKASASAQNVLSRHLEIMASIYPPNGKELPRKELIAARSKDRSLWKKGSARSRKISLNSNPSAFFRIYQPAGWKIIRSEDTTAGKRFRLAMTVGSKNQIRLHKGPFSREVEYALTRHRQSWYLTSFADLSGLAKEQSRQQQARQAQKTKKALAVAAPESGSDGKAVLDAYFKQLQAYYPPGSSQPGNPMLVADETKRFWNMGNRKARSSHSRSMALFMMFRPTAWKIDEFSTNGNTAKASVSFTIGNKNMLRLNRGNPTKSASYSLVQDQGNWLLNSFTTDR